MYATLSRPETPLLRKESTPAFPRRCNALMVPHRDTPPAWNPRGWLGYRSGDKRYNGGGDLETCSSQGGLPPQGFPDIFPPRLRAVPG